MITVDVDARRLNVELSANELDERRRAWMPPAPHYPSGVMAKYAYLVAQADDGAITNRVHLTAQQKQQAPVS